MQDIINAFMLEGQPVRCIPYGSGHINQTWLIETDKPHRYILQKVNTGIFKDPDGLMDNIVRVTEYLRDYLKRTGGDAERGAMTVIRTVLSVIAASTCSAVTLPMASTGR